MSDPSFDQRLKQALQNDGLDPAAQQLAQEVKEEETASSVSGMRIGAEFVSGPIAGCLLGYGLDKLFDSLPLCLILGLLFGFGAGVLNVYRAMNNIPEGIGIHHKAKSRK